MSHQSSRSPRRWPWIAAGAAALAGVAGLLVAANPGAAAGAGNVNCPAKPTNQVVLVGVSSSGRDARIISERQAEVAHLLGVAGYCRTKLLVQAWSTAGAVRTLWSPADPLAIPGQTAAGRRRRINKVVGAAMKTVDARFQQALDELPPEGSDFLAWPNLAADADHELADNRPVAVTVLDDGVQSADPNLNQPLTIALATRLAVQHRPSADLHGLTVVIEGVGQVAGLPAPAGGEWVPAVRAFAHDTCAATGAACTVLTSTSQAG